MTTENNWDIRKHRTIHIYENCTSTSGNYLFDTLHGIWCSFLHLVPKA